MEPTSLIISMIPRRTVLGGTRHSVFAGWIIGWGRQATVGDPDYFQRPDSFGFPGARSIIGASISARWGHSFRLDAGFGNGPVNFARTRVSGRESSPAPIVGQWGFHRTLGRARTVESPETGG